jgi:hypothetical protein
MDSNAIYQYKINNNKDVIVEITSKLNQIIRGKFNSMFTPIEHQILEEAYHKLTHSRKKNLLFHVPETELFKLSKSSKTILSNKPLFFEQLFDNLHKQGSLFFTI